MVTRDVLKFLKFENFQNITCAHKSRNARARSYDFLYIKQIVPIKNARETLQHYHIGRNTECTSVGDIAKGI